MRALTVRQPWCWSIVYASKRVENRSRPIPSTLDLPARVALHAGKAWDDSMEDFWPWDVDMPRKETEGWHGEKITPFVGGFGIDTHYRVQSFGAIVAVIELTGCHHADEPACARAAGFMSCSMWANDNAFHWQIGDVTPLADPIPCRGMLGLWTVPDELVARINQQVVSDG